MRASPTARNLALLDVYGRLIRVLNTLAGGDPRRIAARPRTRSLANRVGASREVISKLMKDLQRGGYVENDGAGMVIVRPLPSSW